MRFKTLFSVEINSIVGNVDNMAEPPPGWFNDQYRRTRRWKNMRKRTRKGEKNEEEKKA